MKQKLRQTDTSTCSLPEYFLNPAVPGCLAMIIAITITGLIEPVSVTAAADSNNATNLGTFRPSPYGWTDSLWVSSLNPQQALGKSKQPYKYRMVPLPTVEEGETRTTFGTSDKSISGMRQDDAWGGYALFRLNDSGQVAGWTNFLFECDDSDSDQRSGKPTAASWAYDATLGSYPQRTLLQVEGQNAHGARATGITESGKIVGLRQSEGDDFEPGGDTIKHCGDSRWLKAVYWDDKDSAGVLFPHGQAPDGYGQLLSSAAFDVIEFGGITQVTGIIDYGVYCPDDLDQSHRRGDPDRWFCWQPDSGIITQPPAADMWDRDIHALEFCDTSSLSGMVGTGLPRRDEQVYNPCSICPFVCGLLGCCYSFQGYASTMICNSFSGFNKVLGPVPDCEPCGNCGKGPTVENASFFSEVNRAADRGHVTGWQLGADGDTDCWTAAIYRSSCGGNSEVISSQSGNLAAARGLGIRYDSASNQANIVGWQRESNASEAMLWTGSAGNFQETNLNQLLESGQIDITALLNVDETDCQEGDCPPNVYHLLEAHDINNNGWIVAMVAGSVNHPTCCDYFGLEFPVVLIPVEDEDPCPSCDGDLTNDGQVDGADLTILLSCWSQSSSECECSDIERNGLVDGADLTALLGAWGPCPVNERRKRSR